MEEVNAAERSIKLSGVDLVDGTPVLDIKPYVPDYDRPHNQHSGCMGGKDGVRVAVSRFYARRASVLKRRDHESAVSFLQSGACDWILTLCDAHYVMS